MKTAKEWLKYLKDINVISDQLFIKIIQDVQRDAITEAFSHVRMKEIQDGKDSNMSSVIHSIIIP